MRVSAFIANLIAGPARRGIPEPRQDFVAAFRHAGRVQVVERLTPVVAQDDQVGAPQDGQVMRNRGLGQDEVLSELTDTHLTVAQQRQDTLARLVRHRLQESVEVTTRYFAHERYPTIYEAKQPIPSVGLNDEARHNGRAGECLLLQTTGASMSLLTISTLTLLIFAAAALYASVGHAGASGYLAAMALFDLAPETMRPTALALNILVAAVATVKFHRAGYFSWPAFWPFALASVPLAFVGGTLSLPGSLYRPLVALVLLYAAYRLLAAKPAAATPARRIPLWAGLAAGAGIGLLSGLTGVGGGIFLSPLLLLMNWAEPRSTSGVSAAFILVNSTAGLLGQVPSLAALPGAIPLWALAAVAGGWIGAEYGSRRLGNTLIQRLLAVVLIIAGLKMAFT
jgi:hypothetical protein